MSKVLVLTEYRKRFIDMTASEQNELYVNARTKAFSEKTFNEETAECNLLGVTNLNDSKGQEKSYILFEVVDK